MLRVFIPRYQQVELTQQHPQNAHHSNHNNANGSSSSSSSQLNGIGVANKSYFVYIIEVSTSGQFRRVERRYSQFLSLHHELKKTFKATPEFPPKKLRNSTDKVLEQRRRGLESYLQHFARMEPPSQAVLDFLEVPKEALNVHKRL